MQKGANPVDKDIPDAIVEYIAKRAGLAGLTLATYPKRTRARHRIEIRCHLGIHRWGGAAQSLAVQTIERIVGGRVHLSDRLASPSSSTLNNCCRHWWQQNPGLSVANRIQNPR
jgi:Domain of unknown function (DUF4158)